MDNIDDIDSTTVSETEESSTHSATLRLYDIFIPLLGFFIISLNLLVVISSGLLLKRRKFLSLRAYFVLSYQWHPYLLCNKNRLRSTTLSYCVIMPIRTIKQQCLLFPQLQDRTLCNTYFAFASIFSRSTSAHDLFVLRKCWLIEPVNRLRRSLRSILPKFDAIWLLMRLSYR